jgi:hypothetical protein
MKELSKRALKGELMPVDYIEGNKKLERIFNNYERIWVNRILSKVSQKG